MRTFENEEFTAFHDRGGNVYEDIHFKRCTFISSSVSITYDPANRSTVRNVTLERCRVVGSSLRCAVVEDVLVDGLQTSDLHQAWGDTVQARHAARQDRAADGDAAGGVALPAHARAGGV
jgi:hypothetical protein